MELEWCPASIGWEPDSRISGKLAKALKLNAPLLLLRDSELNVVGAFGQFYVIAVVGYNLAGVGPGRQRFFQNIRRSIHSLVDVVVFRLRVR